MTTVAQAAKKVQKVTFPPLTPADRSCAHGAAQALVRVAKGTTDLLLDGHTYTLAEPTLLAQGWEVIEDIREAVLNPPKTAFDSSEN